MANSRLAALAAALEGTKAEARGAAAEAEAVAAKLVEAEGRAARAQEALRAATATISALHSERDQVGHLFLLVPA